MLLENKIPPVKDFVVRTSFSSLHNTDFCVFTAPSATLLILVLNADATFARCKRQVVARAECAVVICDPICQQLFRWHREKLMFSQDGGQRSSLKISGPCLLIKIYTTSVDPGSRIRLFLSRIPDSGLTRSRIPDPHQRSVILLIQKTDN
jgi:hypothetical protein